MKEALRNNFRNGASRMQTKEERDAARRIARQISRQQRELRFQLFLHHRYVQRPLFWIGTLLGIIWAAPLTMFGLLIACPVLLVRGHAQVVRGHTVAILVRGPFADWMLGHHPFGAMTAMALGHVVIAEKQGLSARVLTHELTHVRQAARWGIVFPFAYLISSAWAAIRGRDAYWHNRFEIAARKAEKRL